VKILSDICIVYLDTPLNFVVIWLRIRTQDQDWIHLGRVLCFLSARFAIVCWFYDWGCSS